VPEKAQCIYDNKINIILKRNTRQTSYFARRWPFMYLVDKVYIEIKKSLKSPYNASEGKSYFLNRIIKLKKQKFTQYKISTILFFFFVGWEYFLDNSQKKEI